MTLNLSLICVVTRRTKHEFVVFVVVFRIAVVIQSHVEVFVQSVPSPTTAG